MRRFSAICPTRYARRLKLRRNMVGTNDRLMLPQPNGCRMKLAPGIVGT
jgi:hypothetical protein